MNANQETAQEFAKTAIELGFDVYLAESGHYGFFTDDTGKRVASFQVEFGHHLSISGNYASVGTGRSGGGSGTGWGIDDDVIIADLTPETLRGYLYAKAPSWANRNPIYTTLERQIERYGSSSKYKKVAS